MSKIGVDMLGPADEDGTSSRGKPEVAATNDPFLQTYPDDAYDEQSDGDTRDGPHIQGGKLSELEEVDERLGFALAPTEEHHDRHHELADHVNHAAKLRGEKRGTGERFDQRESVGRREGVVQIWFTHGSHGLEARTDKNHSGMTDIRQSMDKDGSKFDYSAASAWACVVGASPSSRFAFGVMPRSLFQNTLDLAPFAH